MKYNEKKSLYESIMKEVAKVVKKHVNESGVQSLYSDKDPESEREKSFVDSAKKILNLNQINGKDAKYVMQIILYLKHFAENNKTDELKTICSSINKHYFVNQNWYKTVENSGRKINFDEV